MLITNTKLLFQNTNNINHLSNSKKIKYNNYLSGINKIATQNLIKKYGPNSKDLNYKYLGLIMENLIFNKNSHLVTMFKDYMIIDYIEEFLKRFYSLTETRERIPKFALFYKNYLTYFCTPTIKEKYSNSLIHNRFEKKAELFYNANYRNKKNKDSTEQENGLCEDSESSNEEGEDDAESIIKIEKTIFNETIKNKIAYDTPINNSMVLPETVSKIKMKDDLLITNSNESSLKNIITGMTVKKNNLFGKNVNSTNYNNLNQSRNKCIKKINENFINSYSKTKIENNNYLTNNNLESMNIPNSNNNLESPSSLRKSKKKILSCTLQKLNTQNLQMLLKNTSCNIINQVNKNSTVSKKTSGIITFNNNIKNMFKNINLTKLLKRNVSYKENCSNTNYLNINNNSNYKNNNKNLSTYDKNKIKKNTNISYITVSKKKTIPKSRNTNKSTEEINKVILQSKAQTNTFNNATGFYGNSFIKQGSVDKIKVSNKKSCNIKNVSKNECLINHLQLNQFHSLKKMKYKPKITLKKQTSIKKTGFTSLIKEISKKNSKTKNNGLYTPISYQKQKHIHNVNININNQINIGLNQFHELIPFSGTNKKYINKILSSVNGKKKKINSRNKNQSLEFNTINSNNNNCFVNCKKNNNWNNTNINNNINFNCTMYKTHYKFADSQKKHSVVSGTSGGERSENNKNFKKKLKFGNVQRNNPNFFISLKSINNNQLNCKKK